ncbi:MAG: hypothetical protein EZS28_031469 [Streblomastix strix]|uniref:Uncharacterized protein n=1 Tax=Streblomastix strix TaxID=222440 RepID=A0A5J4URM1_9EUKA|nr:MAG: hypothetical protein EZS28_031469 [Streblomastix strix]
MQKKKMNFFPGIKSLSKQQQTKPITAVSEQSQPITSTLASLQSTSIGPVIGTTGIQNSALISKFFKHNKGVIDKEQETFKEMDKDKDRLINDDQQNQIDDINNEQENEDLISDQNEDSEDEDVSSSSESEGITSLCFPPIEFEEGMLDLDKGWVFARDLRRKV